MHHYGADAATRRYFTVHTTADVHHARVWRNALTAELARTRGNRGCAGRRRSCGPRAVDSAGRQWSGPPGAHGCCGMSVSFSGRNRWLRTACVLLGVACALPAAAQEVWRFDQTASLGGHPTKVLGAPKVIDTRDRQGGRVQRRGRRAVLRRASAGRRGHLDVGDDLQAGRRRKAGAADLSPAVGRPGNWGGHRQRADAVRDSHSSPGPTASRAVVPGQLCHGRRPVAHAAELR